MMKNYTLDDGLVSNKINKIFQDSRGFMWFATRHGLSRYDGNRFTNFTNKNGLTNIYLSTLFEDEKGTMYIATGAELLPMREGKIGSSILKKPINIRDVLKQTDSTFIFGTNEDGIVQFKNGKTSQITGPLRGATAAVHQMENGYFLAGGLYFHNDIYVTSLKLFNARGELLDDANKDDLNTIYNLFEDAQGRVWISAVSGLHLLSEKDLAKGQIKLLPLPSPFNHPVLKGEVTDVLQDQSGNYWIATVSGLVRISSDNRLTIFTESDGLSSNIIRGGLLKDKQNNLWVGTEKGITKVSVGGNIQFYRSEEGISDNELQSVLAQNENEIWITTVGGHLQKFNPETTEVNTFDKKVHNGFFKLFKTNSGKVLLGHNPKNEVYARWHGVDLYNFNTNTGTAKKFLDIDQGFFAVESDDKENYFIASIKGLIAYNAKTKQRDTLANISERVDDIAFDQEGNLWAACRLGNLFRIELNYSGQMITAKKEKMNHMLAGARPTYLFVDKSGAVWVGSWRRGITKITKEASGNYHSHNITPEDGLFPGLSNPIAEDDSGGIYVRSGIGMDKLIPTTIGTDGTTYKVFNFSRENNFYTRVWDISIASSGTVWVATENGLAQINDQKIENKEPPEIYITQIVNKTNEEELQIPVSKKKLSLKYNHGNLQFDFFAPYFINENAINYSYRLKGASNEAWSPPANKHSISYAGLQPGNYDFEVRTVAWDDEPGEIANFVFTINPPWWQTWWFRLMAALLLICTAIYFMRWRIKNIRNKAVMVQKIALTKMKSRFFANISHEFRTPLTLIKSPVQKLQTTANATEQKQLSLIDHSANRMLELVDQLLELSKIESGNLKIILKQGNLPSFLNALVDPFTFKAKEDKVPFELDIKPSNKLHYFDKDILTKIVVNLLSNAFKYSDKGKPAGFKSKIKGEQLHLEVSNYNNELSESEMRKLFDRFYQNNPASTGYGIGLAMVKDLVGLYEGSIETDLQNEKLTFTVQIPLCKTLKNAVVIEQEKEQKTTEATSVTDIENETEEKPILLIAEDNADIRSVLNDLFTHDFSILEARDGLEAYQLAQDQIPDCIISDVMMPKMDGFNLVKQLKENELTSSVPVVLLTAKSGDDSRLQGLQSHADAYLTKPFNHSILKEKVKQLLHERQKLKERYSQELVLKVKDMAVTSTDEQFIKRLEEVLENELDNADFTTEEFANQMLLSRMQLHRKLKSLLGVSATEFLRNERLKAAAKLLKNHSLTVSEIAYSTGFNNVRFFSTSFKKAYKLTPTAYRKKSK